MVYFFMVRVNNRGYKRGSSGNISAVTGYFRKLTVGVHGGIFSLSENRSGFLHGIFPGREIAARFIADSFSGRKIEARFFDDYFGVCNITVGFFHTFIPESLSLTWEKNRSGRRLLIFLRSKNGGGLPRLIFRRSQNRCGVFLGYNRSGVPRRLLWRAKYHSGGFVGTFTHESFSYLGKLYRAES